MSLVAIALLVLAVIALSWLYSFFSGRPWTLRQLQTRTFLKFALTGPELLTMLGILEKFGLHGHNARLSNASEAAATKQHRSLAKDLRILRSYSRKRLPPAALLSADIMDWFLDDAVYGERFRYHDYPVNQMFGAQSSLPDFMMNLHPVVSALEGRNYVRRLSRFGVKLDQVLEGVRIRADKGVIPPRFVIRRVLDEMRAFIRPAPGAHALCVVLDTKLAALPRVSAAARAKLVDMAREQVRDTVYPAYRRLIDYFARLESRATDDDGVWKLPNGDSYYAYCLRSNTTVDKTPEAVHETGLAEVARIESDMKAIFKTLGNSSVGNPTRELKALGSDPRFLFPDSDEGRKACLDEYTRILAEMSADLDAWFAIKPKARLEVRRIPEFKEATAPGAYYQMPDLGGGRPGVFYANLRNMAEVPRFGMKTLAYHEGIPGHHFQLALAQEQKGLPLFRRFLPFTAYAEGWAMYSELLAREMGRYEGDPYGLLGSLDSELFRAVRLVVDTGIHAKKWTRQEAIDYMGQHSAQAEASIVSEIERYIVMPGQACAYKVGMMKMVELRDKARAGLGERFDIRAFHTVVLANGSMPLDILERRVDAYLADAKR